MPKHDYDASKLKHTNKRQEEEYRNFHSVLIVTNDQLSFHKTPFNPTGFVASFSEKKIEKGKKYLSSIMTKKKLSLTSKGSYVLGQYLPHSFSLSLSLSLSLSHNLTFGVGHAGQWIGEAHNTEATRFLDWHQVWRNGQSFRPPIQ